MNDEELENTLVEALCKRNNWEVGDNEDYDIAVRDVKWFLSAAKPAIEKQERIRLCDEVERYFSTLKNTEPPIIVTDFLETKLWWQNLRGGKLWAKKTVSGIVKPGKSSGTAS